MHSEREEYSIHRYLAPALGLGKNIRDRETVIASKSVNGPRDFGQEVVTCHDENHRNQARQDTSGGLVAYRIVDDLDNQNSSATLSSLGYITDTEAQSQEESKASDSAQDNAKHDGLRGLFGRGFYFLGHVRRGIVVAYAEAGLQDTNDRSHPSSLAG